MTTTDWRSKPRTGRTVDKWSSLPPATWFEHSACRGMDPDIFFPDSGHHLLTRAAIETCNTCPVQMECLDYAIKHHLDHGIWGGTSERERVRIRRGRKALRDLGLDENGLRLAESPDTPAESAHG